MGVNKKASTPKASVVQQPVARKAGGTSLINILSVLVGILSAVAMLVANLRFNTFGKLFMIVTRQNTAHDAIGQLFSAQVG